MQVSATLIAAQQAAREARTRLNVPQASQPTVSEAGFAKALDLVAPKDSFAALPFQQKAGSAQAAAPQQPAAAGKLGQHINIIV